MRREGRKAAHSKGSAWKRKGKREHMPYIEVDRSVETKLSLISSRARQEPGYQFTCLAHLLSEGFLARCYRGLGRNKAAGIDGVRWKEYGRELERNLKGLVERMKAKRYRPEPARRVYIPKDEKTKRPLGIPAQEDKVVQKAVSRILEAIYEADFKGSSHGFRPGGGCHTALKAVNDNMWRRPVNHVIEADIKGFFDNVSHEWMMTFLRRRVKDPSLLRIIGRFLIAGYMDSGLLVTTEKGTPQGGNLSPMLANIFLHYVLDEWFEKEVKPGMRGESYLVRYADDFIIMVQYKDEAEKVTRLVQERFAAHDLQLHPDKTRVISFGRYEKENAKKQGRSANTFDFLGFTHFCDVSRTGRFKVGRRTTGKRLRKKLKAMNLWLKTERNKHTLGELWRRVAEKLRGHYQYYGVSENIYGVARFYYHVIRMVFKWLNRRSQRRSLTWEKFRLYLEKYPLPKPRIVQSFYTMT